MSIAEKEVVSNYYGKTLQSNQDLKTNACCSYESEPPHIRQILNLLDPEIQNRFYGCGSPIPLVLEGKTVLDLGCGSGRDVYICSKLVGEAGKVVGVDMTQEQLQIAQKHLQSQMQKFGFKKSNVEFKKGEIEDLQSIGIEDSSVDVVISNCVINLSSDKKSVFKEIFRTLKPGGEFYFSDVFAGQRVPQELNEDPILKSECLAGALYIEDFRRLMRELGCLDYRVMSRCPSVINNPDIENKIAGIDFFSMTIRAFKLADLEDICENYGESATYLGTIKESPNAFTLDDHHLFQKGIPLAVCGNTSSMLKETRFSPHFKIMGDRKKHYGPFPCQPEEKCSPSVSGGSCC